MRLPPADARLTRTSCCLRKSKRRTGLECFKFPAEASHFMTFREAIDQTTRRQAYRLGLDLCVTM